jgi:hypothetical protein
MIYTQEILEDIELDAQLGKSLLEISVRLGIPYSELYRDYANPDLLVKKFYDFGISKGKTITDNALFKLAENGSSSAKDAYDKKLTIAHFTNVFNEIDSL